MRRHSHALRHWIDFVARRIARTNASDSRFLSGLRRLPKDDRRPAGEFMMGSPDKEAGRSPNEGPQHKVTIGQPFAIAERWVSRGEFDKFVKDREYALGDKCKIWKDGIFT
jgi:Sulfatase-modifying factor enzyme 1